VYQRSDAAIGPPPPTPPHPVHHCAPWPLADMALGERAVLEVQPSYGFKHRDCKMPPPAGVRPEDPLIVDAQVRQGPGTAWEAAAVVFIGRCSSSLLSHATAAEAEAACAEVAEAAEAEAACALAAEAEAARAMAAEAAAATLTLRILVVPRCLHTCDMSTRERGALPWLQLTSWYPGAPVKAVGPGNEVVKRILKEGEGWETPRPPFEVRLPC
jgi:hypothetical protein